LTCLKRSLALGGSSDAEGYRKTKPRYSQNPDKELTAQEKEFARYLAVPTEHGRWRSKTEAYALAFPTANQKTAAKRGSELYRKPALTKLLEEYRAEWRAALKIDEDWIRQELLKRYHLNPAEYWVSVDVTASGKEYQVGCAPKGSKGVRTIQRHKRLDELTPEQLHVVDAFSQEVTARGTLKTEFKFARQAALESLMKGAGFYKDRVDLTTNGQPIENLTDDERIARIVALVDKAKARKQQAQG
jgi:hypothetical protein